VFVVLPALAGTVITGWREGADEPWPPLPSWAPLLACLGGLARSWLSHLVQEAVRFLTERDRAIKTMEDHGPILIVFAFVLGMVGVFMGGIGRGLWGLLARRPALRLHPR
jgi:hypothetical protein